jgi:hypothetical protein
VKIARYLNFAILENESNTDTKMKHRRYKRLLLLLVIKVKRNSIRKIEIHTKIKKEKEGRKRPSFLKIANARETQE